MTKLIKLSTLFTALVFLLSFTSKSTNEITGTYSVPDSDPSNIKLTINADNTFTYQDYSIQSKKISVKGNWTMKGKKVVLKDYSSDYKFHTVWNIVENGKVAKSRKGLTFYRLIKID